MEDPSGEDDCYNRNHNHKQKHKQKHDHDKNHNHDEGKIKIFAVVNRLSGKGRNADIEAMLKIVGKDRWEWELFEIKTGAEDVKAAVKQRVVKDREFDWVFACGGDGTISSLVSLLSGTGIPIGVIPLGTGNAFAQEMGIPLNWKKAMKMLANHHAQNVLVPRPVDVMKVGDRYCMLTVDIGIGAKTVESAARVPGLKRRLGVGAYLLSASKEMALQTVFRGPIEFTVNVDGNIVKKSATEVVLCNAGMLGLGHDMRWGPGISVYDGAIDLVFVKANSVPDYLRVIHAIRTGHSSRRVTYLRAHEYIEISCKEEVPVAADGDLIGKLPVKVKVIRGAVNVLMPMASPACV